MARPATTDAQRIARTVARAAELQDAVALAVNANAFGTRQAQLDAWKVVATLAGNIQRDTRQLAGLGRGG
jgi:hypothetical protein